MDTLTVRARDRFSKAVASLNSAIELPPLPDHANRDAVLLRFELATEMMSKTLRRALRDQGAEPGLPKDVVRTAVVAGILTNDDAELLLAAIDDRNRMVHDYSEQFSVDLFARIRTGYRPAFARLLLSIS